MTWHIWMVEQSQWLKRDLIKGLQAEGIEVMEVVGGQRIQDVLAQEGLPHLAVVEVSELDGSGLEVIRDLTQRGLPVIGRPHLAHPQPDH